ncbi:MAG: type III pantothenate kinase [Pseudomonadota bacterium]
MLLAIDSGNTNFEFAVFDGDRLCGSWRTASDANRTADEYLVWLTQLMGLQGLKAEMIDGAIISSVVPAALYPLASLCSRYFGVDPLIVGRPGVELGIEVRVEQPEAVGADRLVNSIAAHEQFGGPLIVVDFGTATSFDVVGSDGAFEGGVLAPGVNLSLQAFHLAAAKLPLVRVRMPEQVIGKATEPAMESGIFWGYIGLVEGLVARIKSEYGAPMKVIATGGLATLFDRATPVIEHVDPELTLRGLLSIYRTNGGSDVRHGVLEKVRST